MVIGMGLGRKTCFIIMMSLTTGLFFVELSVGNMTNSMALVADSFHVLSDIISLAVGYFALLFSKKRNFDGCKTGNTYGWVRTGVLGALINAVFLIALCLSILLSAIKRFIMVEQLNRPIFILSVGSLGLVINIIGMYLFYGHAQSEECEGPPDSPSLKRFQDRTKDVEMMFSPPGDAHTNASDACTERVEGKRKTGNKSEGQLVMKVVLLDKMGDALGSIIVIIAALVIHFVGHHKWTLYIDPALSLIMTCIILHSSIPLLKESSLILLQNVPPHIQMKDLEHRLLESFPEIIDLHDFHVWQLAGDTIIASLHVKLPSKVDYDNISAAMKQFFHFEGIHSTTIQPEFQEELADKRENQCLISCINKSCEEKACCLPIPGHRNSELFNNEQVSGPENPPTTASNSAVEGGNNIQVDKKLYIGSSHIDCHYDNKTFEDSNGTSQTDDE